MNTVRDILLLLNTEYKIAKKEAADERIKPSQETIFLRALYHVIQICMEQEVPAAKYTIRKLGTGMEVVRDGIKFHAVHEGDEIQFYIKRELICTVPETFLEQYISVGFDAGKTHHYPELAFIAEFVLAIETLDLERWKRLAA